MQKLSTEPETIVKRDGSRVPFEKNKIQNAISKALLAVGDTSPSAPIADAAVRKLCLRTESGDLSPTVESIQDLVEEELMSAGRYAAAKAYITYRGRHQLLRESSALVPQEVVQRVNESKKYFKNTLSEFIYYSTYSRWLPEKNRREAWTETVSRYMSFMRETLGEKLSHEEYEEVHLSMLNMEAMGSMRLLWSAGDPVRATNVCAYNCSFIAPTCWKDFAEIMYISMCGTGVGFSVERQTVDLLPVINHQGTVPKVRHTVADSKEGWGDALVRGMNIWASGADIEFDYSYIRPKGSRLKTMGGRASGPEPLRNLFEFTRAKMLSRQGQRLSTLDVHDIVCKIGEIVVAGGVRRSALISLSDLDDLELRNAKNGQFYTTNPQRSMANNSAVYNAKPTMEIFLDEWHNLVLSGSGERGIFNRGGLKAQLPERRWKQFSNDYTTCGTNPCGEIILKSKQFCNLSEVVVRPEDTLETLAKKIRVATILGTYQSSLTYFPYLSPEWKQHSESEALLGVSLTGQWDNEVVRKPETQRILKEVAIQTNQEYAKRFGVNPSTCVTCVKPSGNGSQLFDCASGMHPRHSKFYIRRVRIENHNPLLKMLLDQGAPCLPEVGQTAGTATTWVVEFPIKAPEGSIVKKDLSALQQLEYWAQLKRDYCEHNPSVTITVRPEEWLLVGDWVYKHWDSIGGLSFLPYSEHVYQLAPYEEINEDEYKKRLENFPDLNFSKLVLYESRDETTGSKELACVSGLCEVSSV